MTMSEEQIDAGMEKIRAMIEENIVLINDAAKNKTELLTMYYMGRLNGHLKSYSALGGDTSKWRDEKGNLR